MGTRGNTAYRWSSGFWAGGRGGAQRGDTEHRVTGCRVFGQVARRDPSRSQEWRAGFKDGSDPRREGRTKPWPEFIQSDFKPRV